MCLPLSTGLVHLRYLQGSSFNIGAKATGEKFSKRIAGPPAAKPVPKDRKPDWVVKDQTTPEQAVIYRLSGDYNALHIGQCSQTYDTLPCLSQSDMLTNC
jgi:hypothetical protein